MHISTTLFILIISGICSLLIISFGIYSLSISKDNIFIGSGKPEKMASMVLESIYLMAKNLVGIFIISSILVTMSEKLISNEQGLPIVTLVVGYLLGKDFAPTNNNKSK
jgi:hypothetical protein